MSANSASAAPSISAARPIRAVSSTPSRALAASPTVPSTASSATRTAVRSRSAMPRLSAIASGFRTRPSADPATQNTLRPSGASGVGAASAAISRWLAVAPSGTKRFWPSSRQPPGSRTARIAIRDGAWCAPSSNPKAVVISPAAMAGNQAARCASDPSVSIAATPTSALCSSGEATSVRPAASSTRPSDRQPIPEPP